MVMIISGVIRYTPFSHLFHIRIQMSSIIRFSVRQERPLLFFVAFPEPETQKKRKKNQCKTKEKMGIH